MSAINPLITVRVVFLTHESHYFSGICRQSSTVQDIMRMLSERTGVSANKHTLINGGKIACPHQTLDAFPLYNLQNAQMRFNCVICTQHTLLSNIWVQQFPQQSLHDIIKENMRNCDDYDPNITNIISDYIPFDHSIDVFKHDRGREKQDDGKQFCYHCNKYKYVQTYIDNKIIEENYNKYQGQSQYNCCYHGLWIKLEFEAFIDEYDNSMRARVDIDKIDESNINDFIVIQESKTKIPLRWSLGDKGSDTQRNTQFITFKIDASSLKQVEIKKAFSDGKLKVNIKINEPEMPAILNWSASNKNNLISVTDLEYYIYHI